MANRTTSSSSSGDDLTSVGPALRHGTASERPTPCQDDSDSDGDLSSSATACARSRLPPLTPDNDGLEPGRFSVLLAAAVVLLAAALLLFLVRRKLRRSPLLMAPTPSLVQQLHVPCHGDDDDDLALGGSASSQLRPLGTKPRGSSATTSASDLSPRSSLSTAVTRRLSKASSTDALLSSTCVDPVIAAARLPLEQILVHEMVGRGAFGEVFRGSYLGDRVAVKRIVADRRSDLVFVEALLGEAKVLARLEHAFIVAFRGVAWGSLADLCLVTEFLDGGDLRARLHRFDRVEHRPKGFDADKTKIALHVAHAVAYLHSLSPAVLHRDLKSRNVLLDRDLNAKLADFGVAKHGVGSSLWMAPEVMVGGRCDEKADIYSLGVVLAELDTHLPPYAYAREPRDGMRRIPEGVLLQMVSMGKLQLEFSASGDAVSRDMVELARQCVARDPAARPSAAQVLHRIHLIYRKFSTR